jgi:ABC-2 type transport system permease protein
VSGQATPAPAGTPPAPATATTSTASAHPDRIPAGWRVIAGKELGDHITSVRAILILLILGLAGAGILVSVSGTIRTVATQATGSHGVFLVLFTLNPSTSITSAQLPSLVALVGFIGPLLGIALGFDAINGERAEGTLSRLVAQPIHRDDVINGKFLAGLAVIAIILGVVTLMVAAIGIWRLSIVPSLDDVLRIATWYVLAIAYVGFWLALAMLCSVLFRRAATAALVVLAIWLVVTFFGSMIVDVVTGYLASPDQLAWYTWHQDLSRLIPQTLYSEIARAVMDPSVRTLDIVQDAMLNVDRRAIPTLLPYAQSVLVVWSQIAALVAATIVAFAVAYVAFMRQEVRA